MSARRLIRRVDPNRLALPVAVVALLIAATGVTPADAVRAVKRAAFASNAGAVNGIKASRTPRPGELVPLGADGRFNADVLPPVSGARGPRGAEGPVGPRGPSSARVRLGDTALLGYAPSVQSTVATLTDVAAGSYFVLFTGDGAARVLNVRGYIACFLRVNGAVVAATDAIVGETAGATGALPLVIQFPVVRAIPFDLSVTCSADQPSSGEGFRVYRPKLSAIRLDSVITN